MNLFASMSHFKILSDSRWSCGRRLYRDFATSNHVDVKSLRLHWIFSPLTHMMLSIGPGIR